MALKLVATAGSCVVTATKAADAMYAASTATVSVTVTLSRADISVAASEASVAATLAAQVSAAQRFTSTQIQNNTNHLDGLKGCGLSIGCNRVALGLNARYLDQLRPFLWKVEEALSYSAEAEPSTEPSLNNSVSQLYLNPTFFKRVSDTNGVPKPRSMESGFPSLDNTKPYGNGNASTAPFAYWASGSLDYGSTLVSGGANSTNRFTSSGFTLGLDYQWGANAVIGASMGYGFDKTDIDLDGTQVNSSLYSASVYGVLEPQAQWYVEGLLGYGKLAFDGKRFSTTERATFSSNRAGRTAFGQLGFSSLQDAGGFSLTPFIRVNVVNIDLENFSETGAINALSYGAATVDGKTITAGLGISYGIPLEVGKLTPSLKIQFANNQGLSITQNIYYADSGPSAGSYDLMEEVLPQRTGSLSLGVNYALKNELSMGIGWIGTYGSNAYRSNAIKLDIRLGF